MTTVLGTFSYGIGVEVSDYILCLEKCSGHHKNGPSIVGGQSFRAKGKLLYRNEEVMSLTEALC